MTIINSFVAISSFEPHTTVAGIIGYFVNARCPIHARQRDTFIYVDLALTSSKAVQAIARKAVYPIEAATIILTRIRYK